MSISLWLKPNVNDVVGRELQALINEHNTRYNHASFGAHITITSIPLSPVPYDYHDEASRHQQVTDAINTWNKQTNMTRFEVTIGEIERHPTMWSQYGHVTTTDACHIHQSSSDSTMVMVV
jgi:hypothetical protein